MYFKNTMIMILGEYCIDKHGNSCVQTPLFRYQQRIMCKTTRASCFNFTSCLIQDVECSVYMSYTTQYFFIKKGYIRTARFKPEKLKRLSFVRKTKYVMEQR